MIASSEVKPDALTSFLKAALFSPSDDSECVSCDQQSQWFEDEAEDLAFTLLVSSVAADENWITRVLQREITWRLPKDCEISITLKGRDVSVTGLQPTVNWGQGTKLAHKHSEGHCADWKRGGSCFRSHRRSGSHRGGDGLAADTRVQNISIMEHSSTVRPVTAIDRGEIRGKEIGLSHAPSVLSPSEVCNGPDENAVQFHRNKPAVEFVNWRWK